MGMTFEVWFGYPYLLIESFVCLKPWLCLISYISTWIWTENNGEGEIGYLQKKIGGKFIREEWDANAKFGVQSNKSIRNPFWWSNSVKKSIRDAKQLNQFIVWYHSKLYIDKSNLEKRKCLHIIPSFRLCSLCSKVQQNCRLVSDAMPLPTRWTMFQRNILSTIRGITWTGATTMINQHWFFCMIRGATRVPTQTVLI